MSTNSKETLTKKQQEDLNSTFNNLPWGLPLGFPTLSPFGAFPAFGLPTPNFPPLTPTAPSLLSNDSTNPSTSTDIWSNGLANAANPLDYNEYAKQLGFFMNAFNEQQQQQETAAAAADKSKSKTKTSVQASPNTKHSSKSKHDVTNGKKHDDSRRSSASSSSRSKSSTNPTAASSTSSSNKTSTPTVAINPDPNMLDPMAFAAAAAAAAASGGLTFPYFLPSLLSQTPSTTTGTNTNPSTYPFSSLTSSLANPTAGLYPFLSPDWFTSPAALGNLTPDSKQSKKRSKSIRTLTEEQEKNASTSLLHSALSDSLHTNGLRLSRRSSTNDTPGDDTKSNDDDDSDPNPKRKKIDEVNETLVRIPLNRGWKRVTIVRAITRTGVRGDVAYYAPCGRKLRSFQEIDRYLSKKNITDLDRSNFTFSSKVHIGFFHEPKEGPDGKTIFQESTEDEIVNRILEINPKFRRIETAISPCSTPNNGSTHDHEMKNSASPFQHHDFIKALIEQQKLVQQQEFEHQQKLQQEQQEQERKRQELAYLKQIEFKKRQEEKLLLLEQRKAEKNAQREKKIQEKYIEIVQAKEAKRVVEDMQLKDLKEFPSLKPVENMRLSIEAFANCLMIMEFLNNFKHILSIPDHLIPSLNNFQQALLSTSSTRDLNTLCQILLRTALDDPGIPNPKKALTNLGQKLSEIDITEHTFSEILRIYIRERNGFDDKLTQILSDSSFQALNADEKTEILAFLCNDLSTNKRVVEEVDRNLDELTGLKHEKWEIEKRLRRLKFDKYNNSNSNPNVKKMANLIREKDLNSSDNESPDETDDETSTTVNDPAAVTADDQDIETLDETKIDDLDKRYTLVARKYLLIKRRVIHKQCRIRTLHLGQDRYRRRYWYFSHLSGIYVEGLTSGDISADDIQTTVENVTKHKLDNGNEPSNHATTSRSTQRRTKQPQPQARPSISIAPVELSSTNPIESTKTNDNNDDDKQTTNASEDLATMDLSAFCMAVNRDNDVPVEQEPIINGVKTEPSDEVHETKTEEVADDNLPLDLSCSKPKRSCQEDYWTAAAQHPQTIYPLTKTLDQFQELNDLATAAMLLNNIKQEQTNINIQNLITTPFKQETPSINFKEIEQSIREKYQFAQALPIPDDVQSGWWIIQTPDELRLLIKSLAKRGQRERYLCRMLQRYFDVLTQSMLNHSTNDCDSTTAMSTNAINDDENSNEHDEQENSNDSNDNEQQQQQQNFDDTHEMDVLNEIYNLSDRIIASSLQCRSYDIDSIRKRLTYSDIQAKGSEILDEAKHLLTDLERNIERRYLKHPFVRRYELNLSSLNRINQNSTYHHTLENSTNEIVSSSKYDEVPQQLERWRRTVNESRTPAQLALCLTQLERCIAWEKSIMRVFCQICNSDVDEEKLLLCDGCDHGTHTYCFNPPMSFIPPNDWYCYVCIGKAKGENLCFVCGNKGEQVLNRCDTCSKLFHEDCLKNARQQRGKWLCVQCLANDSSALIASLTAGNNTNTKWSAGRQTSRSSKTRQPSITSNGANRSSTNNRKSSKSRPSESSILQESHSNSSHADVLNESSSVQSADEIDESIPSPTMGGGTNSNSKKKPAKKGKTTNNDVKSCRIILNELLKSDASWPFQTPVDAKQHPEYYECVKTPMDFSTMKKKMRNNQYTKRDDFLNDVQLILNNCEYYNEDDSPVGEAGHVLRTFFEAQWAKQFG